MQGIQQGVIIKL